MIIWDKTPMANKAAVECVDSMLQRIMNNDSPFSGKVFITLGDFHQTCPIIQCRSQTEIISTSIQSSYLWPHFCVYHLSLSIRQQTDPNLQQLSMPLVMELGPLLISLSFNEQPLQNN